MTIDREIRCELMERLHAPFFRTGRDKHLEKEMLHLVDWMFVSAKLPRPEGRLLVVAGPSGAGKTLSINQCLRRVPSVKEQGLLSVLTPSPCTLKALGWAFLDAMDYELETERADHLIWKMVRTHLRRHAIKFVWLDEAHHAMGRGTDKDLTKICDTIKSLLQTDGWPISLIISGLPTVSSFAGHDRQVERRSRTVRFDSLSFRQNTDRLRKLVKDVVSDHGCMAMDGILQDNDFLERLCSAAEGAFGEIIKLCRAAVLAAFDRGGPRATVGIEDFADAYTHERGCRLNGNIFLLNGWQEVQPANSRLDDLQEPSDRTRTRPEGGQGRHGGQQARRRARS
ncbi:ATP-binding protein [Nitrospirillum sp. BR 11164]|uniref:ATP-binding protein n=1 Tax=Nitrospirillum sp. BR 11164 TaxID=3104324 RepID=UPI002AFF485C|nr:ATP-binding protein [Nitrospirillum sp. BR 11164]MEA1647815.1 ATP-binding protein [Nitrospirillum sp. BR 11164]